MPDKLGQAAEGPQHIGPPPLTPDGKIDWEAVAKTLPSRRGGDQTDSERLKETLPPRYPSLGFFLNHEEKRASEERTAKMVEDMARMREAEAETARIKSGGIVPNIGVHFFDMLLWIFGPVEESEVTLLREDAASGILRFADATVRWFLSVNAAHLPDECKASGQRTFRSITMEGQEIEFSDGFTDLHTESYRRILAGEGFGIDDALPSIRLTHDIRQSPQRGLSESSHPFARLLA